MTEYTTFYPTPHPKHIYKHNISSKVVTKMHTPILNGFGTHESDLFSMLSVYSDEATKQVPKDGNTTYYPVNDVLTEESGANFFRCFLSCCAAMAAL